MRLTTLLALSVCMPALLAAAQGGTWELEDSGTVAGLRGIHAVNRSVVWASGTGGTVLRSVDGGRRWKQCATPPAASKLDFRAIWAWDAQTALLMSSGPGDQSRLYRTPDGCNSWQLVFSNRDAAGFWDGLLFLDRQHGVIYGDPVPTATRTNFAFSLFMTLDGGSTWTPERKELRSLPGESAFAASNTAMTAFDRGWVWLGTSKGRVLRANPVAEDWHAAQTPLASGSDSSGVFSLAFRDRKHGIAVGGDYRKPEDATGTAACTSDGGEHWGPSRKPSHGYRSAVAWDATDGAWITVGSNGSDVSYDDGDTWQWLDSGNWNALSLPWAVGPNGRIGKLGTLPANPAAAVRGSR